MCQIPEKIAEDDAHARARIAIHTGERDIWQFIAPGHIARHTAAFVLPHHIALTRLVAPPLPRFINVHGCFSSKLERIPMDAFWIAILYSKSNMEGELRMGF